MVNQMTSLKQKYTKLIASGLISAALALSAAQGIAQSSEASQTAEFDEQVRQALLRNPEILLEVFDLLEQEQQAHAAKADMDLVSKAADDLFEGVDLSKPVLVEFQDYNCGYCKRAHATVKQLRRGIPDLQLVIMELPILGEGSIYSAEMALALKAVKGQEAYLEFSDALMSLESSADAPSVLKLLTDLGHNPDEIARAMQDGAGLEELEKSQRLARRLKIQGTPTFVGPAGLMRGMGSLEDLAELAIKKDS